MPLSPIILGGTTITVYRLDPVAFIAPIEPLLDIIPGLTPFRVTGDMVDSEQKTNNYDVTQHPIQFGSPLTSHVRKRLKQMVVTTTLGATMPLLPTASILPFGAAAVPAPPLGGVVPVGGEIFLPTQPPVPGSAFRLDLLRLRNLEALGDLLQPVMVVTPRHQLPRAFMQVIADNWTPELGLSTQVTINFLEANIATIIPQIPSDQGLTPGGNQEVGAGTSATKPVEGTATPSGVTNVPPSVDVVTSA